MTLFDDGDRLDWDLLLGEEPVDLPVVLLLLLGSSKKLAPTVCDPSLFPTASEVVCGEVAADDEADEVGEVDEDDRPERLLFVELGEFRADLADLPLRRPFSIFWVR